MSHCLFLETLPLEVRKIIYENLLSFSRPIKLRQHVAGSPETALLRVNRQVYHEAVSVLYDCNTIRVTRNDFCISTDESIKTPLNRAQVRHLLITHYGQSVACFFNACCVCRADGKGLIETLKTMPRLRSVVINYSGHLENMHATISAMSQVSPLLDLISIGVGTYQLIGPFLERISVIYTDTPAV